MSQEQNRTHEDGLEDGVYVTGRCWRGNSYREHEPYRRIKYIGKSTDSIEKIEEKMFASARSEGCYCEIKSIIAVKHRPSKL